jgi:WD40 repeat protein
MRQQSLWGTMPAAQIKPRTPNIIKTMIRRESYSKHTKNDLQQSMFDLNTHLLKDRLGSRILPWHCAEDEFESALTGGYANYTNNRFPYTAVFSTSAKGGHLLAIGSEDGRITVLDTQKSIDQEGKEKCKFVLSFEIYVLIWVIDNDKLQFKSDVHQNAIFDLLWNNSDAELITASGDRTLKIVDTETQNIKLTLRNHTGSVKSVSAHDSNPNILVSSSRDGSLCLWDTRESTKHSDEQFDDFICSAHTVFEAHKLIRKGSKRKRVEFGSSSSVTSVKFFGNTNTIISAGASDGCVKLWDLRTLKERKSSTIRKSIVPLSEFSPCVRAKCDRPYGIISLDVSLDASQILMSASNHRIYVFESAAMETGEFQTLHGHTANSFYGKKITTFPFPVLKFVN